MEGEHSANRASRGAPLPQSAGASCRVPAPGGSSAQNWALSTDHRPIAAPWHAFRNWVGTAAIGVGGFELGRCLVLWTIFVVLLVLWLLGLVSSYTMGGFIHLLLVIALVVLVIRLIQGRPIT